MAKEAKADFFYEFHAFGVLSPIPTFEISYIIG